MGAATYGEVCSGLIAARHQGLGPPDVDLRPLISCGLGLNGHPGL